MLHVRLQGMDFFGQGCGSVVLPLALHAFQLVQLVLLPVASAAHESAKAGRDSDRAAHACE